MSRVGRRGRRGSLQFWPRKRAERIYPSVNWSAIAKASEGGSEIMSKKDAHAPSKLVGFTAWKAGTTHVSFINSNQESPSSGKMISKTATILDCPSLYAAGIRYYSSTYDGLKTLGEEWHGSIPKELELNRKTPPCKKKLDIDMKKVSEVRIIAATQPRKSGMHKRKPEVIEIGINGDVESQTKYAQSLLGKEISISDIFSPGEHIDVSGITKGSGFTGTVKRLGVRIQGRKDKQMNRHPGSLGSTVPRKVDWRVPQAGQFGYFTRTEYNKRILMIDNDGSKVNQKGGILGYGLVKDFILVEGSTPGTQKRLIVLRKQLRKRAKIPVALEYISTESKQGR